MSRRVESSANPSNLAQSGLAALMNEQNILLDQLQAEIARGGQNKPQQRDDMLMEAMRNMEEKMDNDKYPTRFRSRMDELEELVARSDPIARERLRKEREEKERRGNFGGQGGYGSQNPHQGGFTDAVDQLKLEGSRQHDLHSPVDYTLDTRGFDEDPEEARERRRRQRKLEKKIMKREKLESRPLPDPSVLTHVFNPFRMKQWQVPPLRKYRKEIQQIDKKKEEKIKEIEEYKAAIKAADEAKHTFESRNSSTRIIKRSSSRSMVCLCQKKHALKVEK